MRRFHVGSPKESSCSWNFAADTGDLPAVGDEVVLEHGERGLAGGRVEAVDRGIVGTVVRIAQTTRWSGR